MKLISFYFLATKFKVQNIANFVKEEDKMFGRD